MLLIRCPYCEADLPEAEFRHEGEAHIARGTEFNALSDEQLEAFLFLRENRKGLILERWRHVHGCGRFFNAARHSVSDRFLSAYKAGEPKPSFKAEEIEEAARPKERSK